MPAETELDRCLRRMTEEEHAAGVSINAVARQRHVEMARWYSLQADALRRITATPADIIEICDGPATGEDVSTVLSDELTAAFGHDALAVAVSQSEVADSRAADMWCGVVSNLRARAAPDIQSSEG